jgi:hypothetical protein
LRNDTPLRAGEDLELRFTFANNGGLQPYLGAWAHIVIAAEGLGSFAHIHPLDEGGSRVSTSEVHSHTAEALGPPPRQIRALASFPAAGWYKIWVQTQRSGKVETSAFVVHVAAAQPPASTAVKIPAGAIRIRVTPNGYEPARVEIPAGHAVTLAFERSSQSNCGAKVVFPALGISREIPLGGIALVDLPAQLAGEFSFACGMGMLRGSLVAIRR